MNARIFTPVRTKAALAAILFAFPLGLLADGYTAHRDVPARLLKKNGQVDVASIDETVRSGTSKDIVLERLGEPSVKLPDGSFMYSDFSVNGSGAAGVLVVRFNHDSVKDLKICTPLFAKSVKDNPSLIDAPQVAAD